MVDIKFPINLIMMSNCMFIIEVNISIKYDTQYD